MEENKPQTVLIEEQKKITMTGVASVDSFSAQQIALTLENGRAAVSGQDLKITNFSKTNGSFSASGKISGVRFYAKKEKIVKRLFG